MNNMEIKVGDKVRVSSRLPRIYERFGSMIAPHYECKVVEIDDGMALLDSIPAKYVFLFPLKYLIKVDAEAKEPKFKVGDKVRYIGDVQECKGKVFVIDGNIFFNDYFNQWQASSIKTEIKEACGICNVPLSDLEPYAEPTAPKYKKGDRVKICSKNAARFGCIGTILEVHDNGTVDVDFNDHYVGGHLYSVDFIEPYTEPTEQPKASADVLGEFTPIPRFANPIIGFEQAYWREYEADLAKEIALKVANKKMDNHPEEVGAYAVQVAKAVVENLKNKQI